MQHDVNWENVKTGLRNPFLVFDQLVLEHAYRVPVVLLEDWKRWGTSFDPGVEAKRCWRDVTTWGC